MGFSCDALLSSMIRRNVREQTLALAQNLQLFDAGDLGIAAVQLCCLQKADQIQGEDLVAPGHEHLRLLRLDVESE